MNGTRGDVQKKGWEGWEATVRQGQGDVSARQPEYSIRVIGIAYGVLAALVVAAPAVRYLNRGTQLAVGLVAFPVYMLHRQSVALMLVAAGALAATSIGLLKGRRWALWAGAILAIIILMPNGPIGMVVGALAVIALARAERQLD